ncbi:putative transcriptional regulator [Caulobacter sp. AP07]|uniref:ArsR/SmtB family transcription factor n=1 Tax=Caulobacter sp. AP07 TaxID=1144304 RepID=UPI000271EE2C|nr:metalloregulator ArsR/SmtB family transcription factor [Caulobacter sp. AP07]EJL26029.1 putative transcriptional regulator [Caulobacter sp. AP07]
MELKAATVSLSALGHEGRLAIFRLLVQAGRPGVAAGEIARRLAMVPNTLSANLNILSHAGLIGARREGRSIIYAADYGAMSALLGFLMEDCCGGAPEICAPLGDILAKAAACDGTCQTELETA